MRVRADTRQILLSESRLGGCCTARR